LKGTVPSKVQNRSAWISGMAGWKNCPGSIGRWVVSMATWG
jgi:hypothetical protein